MKSRKRNFKRDILIHCYQRSADRGVIFYSIRDYLVWFTNVCTCAREFDVQVLALCPMPDHTHFSVMAKNRYDLSTFIGVSSQRFAFAYNRSCNRCGQLFEHSFGSAVKVGAKKARTNLIYVGNNVVERQLATKAEECRWSFVAYANSDHPYSEPLNVRKARRPMQRAIQEVITYRKEDKPLGYNQLKRLFKPLDNKEKQQLTDFIIVQYNAIDYDAALAFFDHSYEYYLTALHSTTGSEYDLNEVFVGKSDLPFAQMTRIIMEEKCFDDIHDILTLDNHAKYDLFLLLRRKTSALAEQICHYLHLPMKKACSR